MRERGFTLIEVMAAVAILAIALLSLLRANNQTIYLKAHARDITTATLLAQERLALLHLDPNALEEESEGDFGDRFPAWRWTVTAEEVATPFDYAGLDPVQAVSGTEPPAEGSAQPRPSGSGQEESETLYKLTLTVLWPDGVSEGALSIVEYLAIVLEEPAFGRGAQ